LQTDEGVRALGFFALATMLVGCRARPGRAGADAGAPSPVAAASAAQELEALPVPGYADAVVAPPADGAGPVLVATHGAWDRPEWHCSLWGRITRGRAFVLCPRGKPANPTAAAADQGFYYVDHLHLDAEVAAAFAALVRRYGDRVDASKPVYAGFSQGAIQGAVMLHRPSVHFARAVLVEGGYGGYHEWGSKAAASFRSAGGERVLLACGREQCAKTSQATTATLERAGVASRIVYVPGVGHSYGDGMEDALARTFAWVAEGDARFAAFPSD
jgi:predicted esterase